MNSDVFIIFEAEKETTVGVGVEIQPVRNVTVPHGNSFMVCCKVITARHCGSSWLSLEVLLRKKPARESSIPVCVKTHDLCSNLNRSVLCLK